eukprot:2850843-Amphidinium_carterae.1
MPFGTVTIQILTATAWLKLPSGGTSDINVCAESRCAKNFVRVRFFLCYPQGGSKHISPFKVCAPDRLETAILLDACMEHQYVGRGWDKNTATLFAVLKVEAATQGLLL